MKKQRIQKVITLSPQLFNLASNKAQKLGLGFQEFIRVLITNEVKEEVEKYEMVDEETEIRIGQSEEDIKAGRVKRLNSADEIEKHFNSL